MILVFLGGWRNTVIVSMSIRCRSRREWQAVPAGQTINLMTLGGSLAIGSVDNATVTIETSTARLGKPSRSGS